MVKTETTAQSKGKTRRDVVPVLTGLEQRLSHSHKFTNLGWDQNEVTLPHGPTQTSLCSDY